MEIVYHGHSCIQIAAGGHSLVVDPFLRGNELAVTEPESVKTDAVLLTHAHADHISDAALVATANDCPVVANFELASYMSWQGVKTIGMNLGGTVDLGFARAKMVQAFHSSGIILEEERRIVYGGTAGGYVVEMGGMTVLHAGDTCLFGDMKLIGDRHAIDVAFIPIGDHFTMGPEDAAQAAEWYGAKLVVPVHYDTFPPIRQDPERFVGLLRERGIRGRAMKPGDRLRVDSSLG